MEILNHINREICINWGDDSELLIQIVMHTIAEYQFDRWKLKEAGEYILKGMKKIMKYNSYSINNLYQMASDLKALYKAGVPLDNYRT